MCLVFIVCFCFSKDLTCAVKDKRFTCCWFSVQGIVEGSLRL